MSKVVKLTLTFKQLLEVLGLDGKNPPIKELHLNAYGGLLVAFQTDDDGYVVLNAAGDDVATFEIPIEVVG